MSDTNNVYGIIMAPEGLEPSLQAIKHLVPGGRASIYRSGYNGAETLRLCSQRVEFESDPLEDGVQHLFDGGVSGSLEEIVEFVQQLSKSLQTAGTKRHFEVYDAKQRLVMLIPG